MAECKECLHYEACKGTYYEVKEQGEFDGEMYAECGCDDFKNKEDYIEIKYGKWLPTKTPSYFGGIIYECSLCGAKDGDHTQILGKYCWRCGAIMYRTSKERGGEK